MPQDSLNLRDTLVRARVLPVLAIDRVEDAVPLAEALVAGGITVLEVTLRTEAALAVIEAVAQNVPEAVVGAGTVTRPEDFARVRDAGGRFAVSPGCVPALVDAARDTGLPFLPGVMTPSEAMAARDQGLDTLKLFPATPAGGISWLKAFSGPLPDLAFCPTGGLSAHNFRDYLELSNVLCVGGSWVAPKDAIKTGNWERITELARQAMT